MRKIIRLTESDLHRIIKRSAARLIREMYGDTFDVSTDGEKTWDYFMDAYSNAEGSTEIDESEELEFFDQLGDKEEMHDLFTLQLTISEDEYEDGVYESVEEIGGLDEIRERIEMTDGSDIVKNAALSALDELEDEIEKDYRQFCDGY